jgi:hypothetical protein
MINIIKTRNDINFTKEIIDLSKIILVNLYYSSIIYIQIIN